MRLIEPPDGRPWALLVIAGVSIFTNVVLLARLVTLSPNLWAEEAAPEAVARVSEAAAELPELPDAPADAAAVTGSSTEPAQGLHVVRAPVEHSLARTFQKAAPAHADVVSAVYARLFVWDLDLRRDLQRGDEITVAYAWDGELAHVPAASYRSGKLGTTLNAYRFQATGDVHPSWWNEEGTEVPRRLVDGPLPDYEQVTSLLKDRPRHRGMDFKVPVGTEVVAPRDATVVRTDWNFKYNGNCAELRYGDGTLARFLHLSETSVQPGQRVAAGTPLGRTGNTGRSTAPHLHYELERGGRVVDPIDYHGVVRRTLPAADVAAFRAAVSRYESALTGA